MLKTTASAAILYRREPNLVRLPPEMQLYWDLGQLLAERQQAHGLGKSVVATLDHYLQTEFVGLSGFSDSNP